MEKFTQDYLYIYTTTACTLRCRDCTHCIPYFRSVVEVDLDKTLAALDRLFWVFDYIRELTISGAEAFLWPKVSDLMKALTKYKTKFGRVMVITNASYIPKSSIIETMKSLEYPFIVRVDNYGELSKKHDEVVSLLRSNRIDVQDRCYTGENQEFGGWLELGNFSDKHYSAGQLQDLVDNCRMFEVSMGMFENELQFCCVAQLGYRAGILPRKESDFVDLSAPWDIQELRNAIRALNAAPLEACKYCNSYSPANGHRVPAAIQMKR